MKTALILCLALCLSGCSSLAGKFENRAACSFDGKQLIVASMYGPIGIASKVSAADAAVVCQPAAGATAAK